jgi:hypothetical protein
VSERQKPPSCGHAVSRDTALSCDGCWRGCGRSRGTWSWRSCVSGPSDWLQKSRSWRHRPVRTGDRRNGLLLYAPAAPRAYCTGLKAARLWGAFHPDQADPERVDAGPERAPPVRARLADWYGAEHAQRRCDRGNGSRCGRTAA